MTDRAPGRIMVVDDNPQNVALIQAQLGREGYAVSSATDGRAAIAAATADPPDLILLDVMMPELDGYEVCQWLRADARTATIPIVMLTALHERADKLRALDAGADDFLSKPVDRAELLARVRSLVRQKRLLDDLTRSRNAFAEQAAQLAVERATLHGLMVSMSDGLLVVDAERRIAFSNARAAALLRFQSDAVVGQPVEHVLERLLPTLTAPEAARAGWAAALADPSARPTFELAIAGDAHCDVLVELFPFGEGDRPAGGGAGRRFGLLLRDVTPERDLARAKDEMVSVVSHELRTPLASLVGFAELLLARDFAEAERREFLGIILEEGRRLTALINDFLDLQRMDSGRQIVVPEAIELPSLLARAISAAGDDPARPIALDLPDTLPAVLADNDRVLQVLANLLSNARKFSPAGGEVTVTAVVREGAVELSVRDRGLGLPADAVPRLFQKFYRVDNSDRRQIKGTGLGLAICRQIVEAHGGSIWAESDGPGAGTRFAFTLPIADAVPTGGDVVVVEDDPGFARLIEEELAAVQLSSVRVGSAEAALDRIAAVRPRAVVLDLLLPGLSGEALLSRLRAADSSRMPVVVVTVKDLLPSERRDLERLGAVAVLRKGEGVAARAALEIARAIEPAAVGI